MRNKVKQGGNGYGAKKGENREPVRTGNKNFRKSAERTHPENRSVPMRGGIRF